MNNYIRNNFFYWALVLFITGFFLISCAGTGEKVGNFVGEVVDSAITHGEDELAGKNKGKIRSARVIRDDQNGYLIDVYYRSVRIPQGVSIKAEAYGPYGALSEYQSNPYPITQKSGHIQLQLIWQSSGWNATKPVANSIFVSLFRDENPEIPLDRYTLNLSQPQVGASVITPTPTVPAILPTVVSYSTGPSSSCSSGSKAAFLTTDSYIYFRVQVQNASNATFKYEWREPNGNIYRNRSVTSYSSTICHSDSIPIKGNSPASKPGTWTVKFFCNNNLGATTTFRISNPVIIMKPAPIIMKPAPIVKPAPIYKSPILKLPATR